jgi:hypothetical protein
VLEGAGKPFIQRTFLLLQTYKKTVDLHKKVIQE